MVKRMRVVVLVFALVLVLIAPASAIKVYLGPSTQTGNHSPDFTYVEGDAMQNVAIRLYNLLVSRGFEVRNGGWNGYGYSDSDATSWGADCVLAIHTNAWDVNDTGWHTARGTQIFPYGGSKSNRVSNAQWSHNLDLGNKLSTKLVAKFGALGVGYNGGVYRDDYSQFPTNVNADNILIEALYHDNYNDCQVLKTDAGKNAYALGVYEALCDHYGLSYDIWADTYSAQSYPAVMLPGQQVVAWVEFTNTGTTHWLSDQVHLGAQGPQDRNSPFYTPGDWLSAPRPGNLDQADVAPGGVGRCTFTLTAPTTPGNYVEQFRLVREGVAWFGDTITWNITVQGGSDTEAPSIPTNLKAVGADWNTVHLTWTASSDNLAVSQYEIWRNGALLATVDNVTSYDDTTCSSNTPYSYQVKAGDASNNWSEFSDSASATTWSILLNDPFADLSNWTASRTADGMVRGLTPDTGAGWLLGSGAPSALAADGGATDTNGTYSYSGVTGTNFAVGYIEASVYDSAASGNARQGIAFRKSTNDDISYTRLVYYLGTETYNTSSYNCEVYGASAGWVKHASGGLRSVGWHRLKVGIDGTNVKFYVDGALKDTIAEPAEKSDGVNRYYIGHNYRTYISGWYDDFIACFPTPPTPTPGTATVTSNSITWAWTEGPADHEQGFYVRDSNGGALKASAARGATSVTESNLAPNTTYYRTISAYNGTLESPVSIVVSATTAP